MTNILSQEEVDALLRGISGGDIETDVTHELMGAGDVMPYDLTSQDRIIRGRMPTLEMINERFARNFRASLSSLLRKVVSFSTLSIEMIKFGDFLKTLPVPTSLHLFKMEPLKGNAIFIVESKVIFTLVDIFFGGTGRDPYRVEGRDFSAIESNLIKRGDPVGPAGHREGLGGACRWLSRNLPTVGDESPVCSDRSPDRCRGRNQL